MATNSEETGFPKNVHVSQVPLKTLNEQLEMLYSLKDRLAVAISHRKGDDIIIEARCKFDVRCSNIQLTCNEQLESSDSLTDERRQKINEIAGEVEVCKDTVSTMYASYLDDRSESCSVQKGSARSKYGGSSSSSRKPASMAAYEYAVREAELEREAEAQLAELEQAELGARRRLIQSELARKKKVELARINAEDGSLGYDARSRRSSRAAAPPQVQIVGLHNKDVAERPRTSPFSVPFQDAKHEWNPRPAIQPTPKAQLLGYTVPPSTSVTTASEQCAPPETSAVDNLVGALTTVVNGMASLQSGPKIQAEPFTGDPIGYHKFLHVFDIYTVRGITDPGRKLQLLIASCKGDAKKAIENCILDTDPRRGYEEARKILARTYGQAFSIVGAHIQNLVNGPQLKPNDAKALLSLARDMKSCEMACRGRENTGLDTQQTVGTIYGRLPKYLQDRFMANVSSHLEEGRPVTFSHLTDFVERTAFLENSFLGQFKSRKIDRQAYAPNEDSTNTKRVFTTQSAKLNSDASTSRAAEKCCLCTYFHPTWKCPTFLAKTTEDRWKSASNHRLCFNCLGRHLAKECQCKKRCRTCEGKHHSLLHRERAEFQGSSPKQARPGSHNGVGDEAHRRATTGPAAPCTTDVTEAKIGVISAETPMAGTLNRRVRLKVVPVNVWGPNGRAKSTYAFLDEGSDTTLCTTKLMKELGLEGKRIQCTVGTINGSTQHQAQETGFEIQGISESEVIALSHVLAVPSLPKLSDSIPRKEDTINHPHLYGIEFAELATNDIDLLLGADVQAAHVAKEFRRGGNGRPNAIHTGVGWALVGQESTHTLGEQVNRVNFIHADNTFLHAQMERMYNHDFNDCDDDSSTAYSIEDKRALQIMRDSVVKVHNHYEIALPWRSDFVKLPNNRNVAEKRLSYLKRKLLSDSDLLQKYTQKFEEYIRCGYAQKVPVESLPATDRTWYLPHHSTGEKFRIVFDCAAKFKGVALNDQLLSGPDHTNNLVGVLLRFRENPVTIVADIKGMFHQVKVSPSDRDSLRFLWWPGGDLNAPAEEYQMLVHLFGATSSPSCAGFALRQAAKDMEAHMESMTGSHNLDNKWTAAFDTIRRNFYVDDCLKSVKTAEEAIQLAQSLGEVLEAGGFHLTKFISNNRSVIETIPETERAPSCLNLDLEERKPDRALGVYWNTTSDEFEVKVRIKPKPATRRGILSMVSQIYDPLGFVQPFLLPMKILMQQLCQDGLGWDDVIPEGQKRAWESWLDTLGGLEGISIRRCFRPTDFVPQLVQLHCFCDASKEGYGAVAYLRMVDHKGKVHCSFVMGKSRVTPSKPVTIPRLELTAAVVGVKLVQFIKKELDFPVQDVIYWTDSTSVLQYIRNTTRRFQMFVANRLAIIQAASQPSQWRHVGTKSNPADIASRGLMPDKLKTADLWFNGPSFLWQEELGWPQAPASIPDIAEDHPELKKSTSVNALTTVCEQEIDPIGRLFHYYSTFFKLQKAVAWFSRFKLYLANRSRKASASQREPPKGKLSVSELEAATLQIVKLVQLRQFPAEMNQVKDATLTSTHQGAKKDLKGSRLRKLSPILVDGVLRVGGRLHNSVIPFNARHQMILPSKHHVTRLIIQSFHQSEGHCGTLQTLSAIRQKFWVVRGHSAVRTVLGGCLNCRFYNAPLGEQIMAQLPDIRSNPSKRPFLNVGVDYAGPMFTRIGRNKVKRYIVLFTCLASRAVHLEMACSLETSSYLQAMQRFICRRGRPLTITSDNGTNFVGADRELSEGIKNWNESSINEFMLQKEIDWRFNPPRASHHGGVWERLIRSTRKIMQSIAGERVLNDEDLVTLLTMVERIINDRPLTPVGDDPADLQTLSPSSILTGAIETNLPTDTFMKADGYKKSWRRVNWLAQQFWDRWLKEYLPTLQTRQKWLRPVRNLAVGDFVLIADETRPRGIWPKGLVEEVYPDKHGVVRTVRVKTTTSAYVRDVRKLCLLEAAE